MPLIQCHQCLASPPNIIHITHRVPPQRFLLLPLPFVTAVVDNMSWLFSAGEDGIQSAQNAIQELVKEKEQLEGQIADLKQNPKTFDGKVPPGFPYQGRGGGGRSLGSPFPGPMGRFCFCTN